MALAVVTEAELARARYAGAVAAPGWPDLDGQFDPEGWPDFDGQSDLEGWADPKGWADAEETPRLQLVPERDPVHQVEDDPGEQGRIIVLPVRQRPAPRRRASARVRRRRLLAAGIVVGAGVLTVVPLSGLLGQARSPQPLVQAAEANLPIQSQAGQGTFYVVLPGDTVASIARRIEPVDPAPARADLIRLLGSDRVVPGEHIRLS